MSYEIIWSNVLFGNAIFAAPTCLTTFLIWFRLFNLLCYFIPVLKTWFNRLFGFWKGIVTKLFSWQIRFWKISKTWQKEPIFQLIANLPQIYTEKPPVFLPKLNDNLRPTQYVDPNKFRIFSNVHLPWKKNNWSVVRITLKNTLSKGWATNSLKIWGRRSSRPKVKADAVTKGFSCITFEIINYNYYYN